MKTTTTAQQSSHHWALPVTLLALMLGATPAFAQNGSRTWTGAVNADFYNGGNWSAPGDFPNGNVTFSGNTNTTIDRTSNPYTYVYGLYFNNTLGTQNEFTINGANKFFIGGAIIKTAAVTSGTLTDVINVDIQKAGTAEIFDMGSNHHLTVNGRVYGGTPLTKTGAGTLDILMKSGTYTGTTTINGGTLRFTNEADLRGVGSSQFFINNGSTLEFQSSVGGANRTVLNGKTFTFDGGAGTLNFNNGNHLFQGGTHNFVTTASGSGSEISRTNGGFINNQGSGNTVFTVADGAQDRDLVLSAHWHNGQITKSGAGTMAITGTHSTSRPITINAGTLEVGGSASLNGGTFTSTIANEGTFKHNSTSNQTLSGVISGTGSLEKDNSGTLTLTGTNTYSGNTTVQAGTLVLGAGGSIANSSLIEVHLGATVDVSAVTGGFTLQNSQILSGVGSVLGPIQLAAGSSIAPGMSPGTLPMNSALVMFDGSTLEFELNGGDQTIGGNINDLITGVTDLTLDGILNVTETGLPFEGNTETFDRWVLIEYSGALTDNGLDLGTVPSWSAGAGFIIDLSVAGEVALVAIPEPSSALLIVLGGIGFVFRRRK